MSFERSVMNTEMAFVSPVSSRSPLQPLLPMPSPFAYSVASTGWNSRPSPLHVYHIVLRSLALLLSFVSALSLSLPSSRSPSFHNYQTLTYCFIVNTSAFIYSAYQLFKSIWDLAYRGICFSEKNSDYINLIFDQIAGYLLISSSSVAVLTIQDMDHGKPLWKAAIVAVTISFVTFLVIQFCALLSGYKLCKRIVW